MRKLGLALLLAVAPFGAAQAQAPCSFSGSGSTGVDCLGQTWNLFNGGWGIPGIGLGIIPFNGSGPVDQFSITFNPFGSFDGLIGFGDGYNTSPYDTRFGVTPFTQPDFWSFSGSGNTISFFAPLGTSLDPGETFFVNVQFLNGLPQNLADVSFTASWGPTGDEEVVPEPATMTLLATGLAGMAAARRRKQKA